MAKFTRRQLVTGCSAIYLAALTVLAAIALYCARYFSGPIPGVLSALTVALPALAGVALETLVTLQYELAARGGLQTSRAFQAVSAFFLVYEAVLATLFGTYIVPAGGLACPLRERWTAMYSRKQAEPIRRIQDAFACCGLNSVKDMAFPFNDKRHGDDACTVRYERDLACVAPWTDVERKIAAMMMVVPIAVFLWKVALFLAPGFDTPWLPSAIRLPREDGQGADRARPTITFRDGEGEAERADSLRNEVDRLNIDSNLASRVESGRSRTSRLIQETENNIWDARVTVTPGS